MTTVGSSKKKKTEEQKSNAQQKKFSATKEASLLLSLSGKIKEGKLGDVNATGVFPVCGNRYVKIGIGNVGKRLGDVVLTGKDTAKRGGVAWQ